MKIEAQLHGLQLAEQDGEESGSSLTDAQKEAMEKRFAEIQSRVRK